MAAVPGVYRRILPSPAIDLTCPEGKQLFREALDGGTMEGFFKLIVHFQTQAEPAFCGLASLAVVLNSLAIDPGRIWKGPWRWFDETMLDCCEPLDKVKAQGITFSKVACLGECSGARVEAVRANDSSLEKFRELVKRCASLESTHMIASYDRQLLHQTGRGHFSPIGGYHEDKDMALILDVARFKYPPHWVPLCTLWDAVNTIDSSTGNWRGFMLITKQEWGSARLFTLSCREEAWRGTLRYLLKDLPQLLQTASLESTTDVFATFLNSFPGAATGFVKWIVEVRRAGEKCNGLDKAETQRLNEKASLLQQLRTTELYTRLSNWLVSACPCPLSGHNVLDDAAKACCQALSVLKGPDCLTCAYCSKSDDHGDESTTFVSEHVARKHGVEVLLPAASSPESGSCLSYPSPVDILTILMLALPAKTWSSIHLPEFLGLVSTAALPESLQAEVDHLRKQLLLLYCGEEEVPVSTAHQ